MRKKQYTMIILILVLALLLMGMLMLQFGGNNYALMGKKLSSRDGTYSISVPRSWEECDVVNMSGLAAAKTEDDGMYTMLSLDTYDYGPEMTLDRFVNNYIDYLSNNSDDHTATELVSVDPKKVDGVTGYYYEFITLSDGMVVHMFSFAAKTDDGYLTVDVASNETVAGEKREVAKGIIQSLRVNKEVVQSQDGMTGTPNVAVNNGASSVDAADAEADEEE